MTRVEMIIQTRDVRTVIRAAVADRNESTGLNVDADAVADSVIGEITELKTAGKRVIFTDVAERCLEEAEVAAGLYKNDPRA